MVEELNLGVDRGLGREVHSVGRLAIIMTNRVVNRPAALMAPSTGKPVLRSVAGGYHEHFLDSLTVATWQVVYKK
jgi:hypothetical protein